MLLAGLVAGSSELLSVSLVMALRHIASQSLTDLSRATYFFCASSLLRPSSFFHASYLYLAAKANAPAVSLSYIQKINKLTRSLAGVVALVGLLEETVELGISVVRDRGSWDGVS